MPGNLPVYPLSTGLSRANSRRSVNSLSLRTSSKRLIPSDTTRGRRCVLVAPFRPLRRKTDKMRDYLDLVRNLQTALMEWEGRASGLRDLPRDVMAYELSTGNMGAHCGDGVYRPGDILLVDLGTRRNNHGLLFCYDDECDPLELRYNIAVMPHGKLPRDRDNIIGVIIGVARRNPDIQEHKDCVYIPFFSSINASEVDERLAPSRHNAKGAVHA